MPSETGRTESTGAWGERQAAACLEAKGYRVLETNFRCRYGEIDLIAEGKGYLLFVEVKTRRSGVFAAAAEFVDARKQDRLRKTAAMWLSTHDTELQPRFDVIEIYAPCGPATRHPGVNHLEDAFE